MGKQCFCQQVPVSSEHAAYLLVISTKSIYTLATNWSLSLIKFSLHRVLHVAISLSQGKLLVRSRALASFKILH